jgi:hypothetical protein
LLAAAPVAADTSAPPVRDWRPRCDEIFRAAKDEVVRRFRVTLARLKLGKDPRDDPYFESPRGVQIDITVADNRGQLAVKHAIEFEVDADGWPLFSYSEHGVWRIGSRGAAGPRTSRSSSRCWTAGTGPTCPATRSSASCGAPASAASPPPPDAESGFSRGCRRW